MDRQTIKYIVNTLRKGTITWQGRRDCLNNGRRKNVNGLWENNCQKCGVYFLQKTNYLEVDHIKEIGGFKGNWDDFINRMYCSQSNLQRLCIDCHLVKTSSFNSTLKYTRKK